MIQDVAAEVDHGITPHITIRDGRAAEAVRFYARAFGAKELERTMADDGLRILNVRMLINGGCLMLHDEFPEYRESGIVDRGAPSGLVLHLQVGDADACWERALAAGAQVRFAIADQFWGDRYGQVLDPFGYTWSIGSPTTKH